jgi:hypothetical protein
MLRSEPFLAAADQIRNHPLLTRAAQGELSPAAWRRYFSARLETGTAFVEFLRTLEGQADEQGYGAIAEAAGKNRREELGIIDGKENPDASHARWREWFRVGIARVLAEHGAPIEFRAPADFVEILGYPQTFDALGTEADVIQSAGALAVFEIGLGAEYDRVIAGLHRSFPGKLRGKEWTYLVSHSHHEPRHFDQILEPLALACATDDEVRRATAGADRAARVKLAFLDGARRLS